MDWSLRCLISWDVSKNLRPYFNAATIGPRAASIDILPTYQMQLPSVQNSWESHPSPAPSSRLKGRVLLLPESGPGVDETPGVAAPWIGFLSTWRLVPHRDKFSLLYKQHTGQDRPGFAATEAHNERGGGGCPTGTGRSDPDHGQAHVLSPASGPSGKWFRVTPGTALWVLGFTLLSPFLPFLRSLAHLYIWVFSVCLLPIDIQGSKDYFNFILFLSFSF